MSVAMGIPFDAPLYQRDAEHGSAYLNCQSLNAVFTIKGDIGHLLPTGLVPAADPPLGVVTIARYGFSNVGSYLEHVSGIQARDVNGETGYYIPYIYVTTNDAALAGGREFLGAPKKIAKIELISESSLIQGTLERPTGKRLLTITGQPNTRMSTAIRQMMPSRTICYSVRHLPPVAQKGGVTQLVKWCSEPKFRRDERGEEVLFTGPISLTYDSPSVMDPVHNLAVGQIMLGWYAEYDVKLQALDILSGA